MLRQFALKTLQTTSVRQLISAWCNCVAPREAPWFEQPAAEEVVKRLAARREIDQADAERLRQWVRDGDAGRAHAATLGICLADSRPPPLAQQRKADISEPGT